MNIRFPNLVRWLAVFAAMELFCLITLAQNARWTSLTLLPDGYQEHALVYANGFLYNIGGVSASDAEANGWHVFYSQVYSNGTIGTWNQTTSLPEAVFDEIGVTANGFIYVLAGYHYTPVTEDYISDIVYYSKINPDGTLGAWQTANPLPQALDFPGGAVWNNTIYVFGGLLEGGIETSNVYSASIQADGSVSPWVEQVTFPYPVAAQASVANGMLYVLGGGVNSFSQTTANSYYTKVNADGSLAGWIQTTSLPQGLVNFAAVAANGRIFTIDGFDGSGLTTACYVTPVAGDGSLGAWATITPLPQALTYHAAAVGDSYIFVSGGNNFNNTSAAVYSIPLPSPPASPLLTSQGITNETFQLQLTSSTNTGFGFLASTDLASWTNIGWGFTDTNGLLVFQDTNAASFPRRFYRAYWPLP